MTTIYSTTMRGHMKTTRLVRNNALIALLLTLTLSAVGQSIARHSRKYQTFTSAGTSVETQLPGAGSTWTLLFPTKILDERAAAAAVYDAPTNSLIVFSGASASTVVNDVMALSNANGIGTSDWTTVIPNGDPGSPPARTYHSAVYDAAKSRMIVFGGCTFTGEFCTAYQNDVWVLSNANGVSGAPAWVQLAPTGTPPAARWGHAAAYDPIKNRMIIYGGDNQLVTFSDTWVLSNANGLGGTPAWSQLSPSGGPPKGQDSPSVAYDSANNVLIEFAGNQQDFGGDTNSVWTLSHANGMGGTPVWKRIVANGAAGSPPKRDGHLAAYDPANNRMMIFGGNANTETGFPQLNDAWVLTNANGIGGKPQWNKLQPAGTKPGGRTAHVGGYDSATNRLIIYGGGSWDADFFSTWVLTGANGMP
jgi:Galactose oxidase, central domain